MKHEWWPEQLYSMRVLCWYIKPGCYGGGCTSIVYSVTINVNHIYPCWLCSDSQFICLCVSFCLRHQFVSALPTFSLGLHLGVWPLVNSLCPSWPWEKNSDHSYKPDSPSHCFLLQSDSIRSFALIFWPVAHLFLFFLFADCALFVPMFAHECLKYWCGWFSLCLCLVIISMVDGGLKTKKKCFRTSIGLQKGTLMVPTTAIVKRRQLPQSRQRERRRGSWDVRWPSNEQCTQQHNSRRRWERKTVIQIQALWDSSVRKWRPPDVYKVLFVSFDLKMKIVWALQRILNEWKLQC